jgi:hypothetical protein
MPSKLAAGAAHRDPLLSIPVLFYFPLLAHMSSSSSIQRPSSTRTHPVPVKSHENLHDSVEILAPFRMKIAYKYCAPLCIQFFCKS